MEQAYTFIKLCEENVKKAAIIAQHAPDAWSQQDIFNALKNEHRQVFLAQDKNSQPVAFACFFAVQGAEGADLEMLVVQPELRGQGVGFWLLCQGLVELQKQGLAHCLLEVRQTNQVAIRLYKRCGFKQIAQRTGMYAAPAEDGIMMVKVFDKE